MAHQHLGLAEIQGLAGLGELFDTLVVFENYPVRSRRRGGGRRVLRLAGISGHDATHYPVGLTALPGERLHAAAVDYRPDLFDRADVEAMAARLVRLLEAAVAEPGRAIGSLDILAPDERETLLRGGTTPRPSPRARPRRCRSCLRRRLCARPRPPRWCSRTRTLSYRRAR